MAIETLADAFQKEQERCRNLLSTYESMRSLPGVNVEFVVVAIKDILRRAERAAAEGDVVAMVRLLEHMRSLE
jgi:hypothetical protein